MFGYSAGVTDYGAGRLAGSGMVYIKATQKASFGSVVGGGGLLTPREIHAGSELFFAGEACLNVVIVSQGSACPVIGRRG